MDLGLRDRVVLIGGASRGIGLAAARGFLAEGALVAVVARGADRLNAAKGALQDEFGRDRVTAIPADVTTEAGAKDAVERVVAEFGRLEILVANVGQGNVGAGFDRTGDEWRAVLDVNLVGSVGLVRQAVPHLRAHGGNIVFVSSIAGVEDIGAPVTYAAAKAGLIAAMKGLARELAPGIRVNAVAPGNVLFPGGMWESKLSERREQVEQTVRSSVPLQRFGRPEEVAALIVFVASRVASFITGSCLVIDGGQTRTW